MNETIEIVKSTLQTVHTYLNKKFFSRIFEIGGDPGDTRTDFDDVLGF